MPSLLLINQYGSTPSTGFGGRYFYIAKELASNNNVTLIMVANHHLLRKAPNYKGLLHKEVVDGVKVQWVKLLPYRNAHSPVRVMNWFLFALMIPFLGLMLRDLKAVHFSSPSPVGILGAWLLSKLKKAKLVFDVRDVWPETLVELGGISNGHILIKFLGWVERFAYSKSNIVTSNLPNFDLRLSELGLDTSKFQWVPNGVDLSEASRGVADSTFQLPSCFSGKAVIAYTGTLGEANALTLMLDAACVLKNDDRFVFYFVGEGKERYTMESVCREEGLSNVYFEGALPKLDIYKLHSLVDMLCVGAKNSPLYRYGVAANKLYEYIYSGTPVLYYVPTYKYNPVNDASCGVQIAGESEEEFVKAVNSIYKLSATDKLKMVASGRAYIDRLHSYKNIAHKVKKISYDD